MAELVPWPPIRRKQCDRFGGDVPMRGMGPRMTILGARTIILPHSHVIIKLTTKSHMTAEQKLMRVDFLQKQVGMRQESSRGAAPSCGSAPARTHHSDYNLRGKSRR